MIYCNYCFSCQNKREIEKEEKKAKEFYIKTQCSYYFSCGAYYNPRKNLNPKGNINDYCEIYANKYTCKNRFFRYKNGIPEGTFELQSLTWEECEYLGQLSRERKIKVTGTGKRSLRTVPLKKNS